MKLLSLLITLLLVLPFVSTTHSSIHPSVYDWSFKDFDKIVPLNASSIDNAHFRIFFLNSFNNTIEVKSVNLSGYISSEERPWEKNCSIITTLPLKIPSGGIFSIETDDCVRYTYPIWDEYIVIDLKLDSFLDNGSKTLENKTINGKIYASFPWKANYSISNSSTPTNKTFRWYQINEKGEIIPVPPPWASNEDWSGVYLVIILFIVWFALFLIFKKNPLVKQALIGLLLLVITIILTMLTLWLLKMMGII